MRVYEYEVPKARLYLTMEGASSSAAVGLRVSKLASGHGHFEGSVTQYIAPESAGDEALYRVRYDDGDEEELTEVELRAIVKTTRQGAGPTPAGEDRRMLTR